MLTFLLYLFIINIRLNMITCSHLRLQFKSWSSSISKRFFSLWWQVLDQLLLYLTVLFTLFSAIWKTILVNVHAFVIDNLLFLFIISDNFMVILRLVYFHLRISFVWFSGHRMNCCFRCSNVFRCLASFGL